VENIFELSFNRANSGRTDPLLRPGDVSVWSMSVSTIELELELDSELMGVMLELPLTAAAAASN